MTTTNPSTAGRSGARRIVSAVVASATLLTLTACGSDEEASDTTDSPLITSTETTLATTLATTPATSAQTTPETTGDTTAATATDTSVETTASTQLTPETMTLFLEQLLLTPEEVGPSFVADTYQAGDGTTPCGVDVETRVPSFVTVGTQITSADPLLALIEEIKVYNSESEAADAFALATEGFSCGSGEGLELGDVTDVTEEVGIEAVALTVANEDIDGVLVLALDSDAIIVLQFQKEKGAAEPEGVPSPLTLAETAIAKIAAAFS